MLWVIVGPQSVAQLPQINDKKGGVSTSSSLTTFQKGTCNLSVFVFVSLNTYVSEIVLAIFKLGIFEFPRFPY